MTEKKSYIPSRLKNASVGGHVAGAADIIDDALNKTQEEINGIVLEPSNGLKDRVEQLEEQVSFDGSWEAAETASAVISGSPGGGKITTANAVRGAIDVRTGYFKCTTVGGTAAKAVTAAGYVLTRGGGMRIWMEHANTADNATLNINSTGAKALFYNNERAGSDNTWEDEETITVYYDETANSNAGAYFASNAQGGGGKSKIDDDVKYDYSVQDETGNAIVGFSDGHIMTKEFDSRDLKTFVGDAESTDLDITDEGGNVILRVSEGYVKTKNFDSSVKRYQPYQKRTFFMHDVDTVNYLVTDFTAETIDTYEQAVIYKDNCVLYLPTSYTQEGKPTKIIIYCKHGASTIEQSADDILTGQMGRIFNYMLYLGYGILAADGVPNGWATALGLGERAVGNYVAVESTIRAFDYVKNNYNIDADNVFIFGYSQGGHYVQNVIDNSNIPFAAAAELSPVCSMRYHQWDLDASGTIDGVSYTRLARLNIARIFDFPTVTNNTELLALEYDASKTIGYDPWNRNVENMYTGFVQSGNLWKLPSGTSLDDITMKKHIKCPLKVWAAGNDTALGVDVTKVFIKAIKNSGQAADMQLYSTGGHNIPNNQSSIGTFNYDGSSYSLYPIAKDIAGWFFKFGGNELQ